MTAEDEYSSGSYRRGARPSLGYKRFKSVDTITPINGFLYVNMIAEKIKKLPDEVKIKINELWTHKNKKRIRLQRLGGTDKRSKSKGYVIDNTTVVDGITRRIGDWIKNDIHTVRDIPPYVMDLFNAFIEGEGYQSISKQVDEHDKQYKCRCINAKRMEPMEHGDLVHKQLYTAIRYAVKRGELHDDKRSIPVSFIIDRCTKSAIISMLTVGLIPISSEFPVFSNVGTGSATAIDIICIDTKNDNKFRFIEVKTGNCGKKIKPMLSLADGTKYCQASIDSIQIMLTAYFGYQTYGDKFFPIETQKADFSDTIGVCYTKSWGAFIMNVPSIVCNMDNVSDMTKRVLDRKDGSLRVKLGKNKNTPNSHTVKGTPKKRPVKDLKVGFK
jgi:hypothetical protein